MAKMTAEEKHKKQLNRLKKENETEETQYEQKKSEKDLILEMLDKKGYKSEILSGVPMFTISSQEEADAIRKRIESKFSFGFKYSKDLQIH